jgi:hypothetical protein
MIKQKIKFDRLQPSTAKMNDWWGTINGESLHIILLENNGMVIHPEQVSNVLGIPYVLVTDQEMEVVYTACRKAITILTAFSLN